MHGPSICPLPIDALILRYFESKIINFHLKTLFILIFFIVTIFHGLLNSNSTLQMRKDEFIVFV